jgi:hypothetical protein
LTSSLNENSRQEHSKKMISKINEKNAKDEQDERNVDKKNVT